MLTAGSHTSSSSVEWAFSELLKNPNLMEEAQAEEGGYVLEYHLLLPIELVLAQLLYHFDWELASGLKPEQLDMTEANGLTISKKRNLHLIPIPYHPSFVE
ncbi:hypothetical protein GH714_006921 [Hevea brasiliensis]|uniref:Cytochrome P450 n=1 Tax=Hevea brasiliensis TaxID=3981 RepID=A0A6A6M0Y9_HEVBR|nr:hypothetical protein GH714_006921 [Hevea brasiliensis]